MRWRIGCGIILLLLLIHPWLFGLPGRLQEYRFQHGLKPGMTKDQVSRLWASTGVQDGPVPDQYNGLHFLSVDWATLCDDRGQDIWVFFDRQKHVQSWNTSPYRTGC